ncbi:MAG: 4-phosphopantoate--beta-alanine ligase [Candidatus Poseidoniales archaeon]|tara:strand:+ start:3342 stop:4049 length:708 start_codon:yes stop_codon:yes gene_type:complete
MVLPPKDHPRYKSLLAREKLVDASDVVAKQGLIAHGRGEAFDYLLGEQTCLPALSAIKAAASALIEAKNPVISVNGNVVALAAREVARLSEISGAKVEVNLFHRTPERVKGLTEMMKKVGIDALGENADDKIPGLSSERAKCCSDGIGSADVVLVPLEDGDRCEALVKMGKKVITIDLNPLSRTAQTAHITIVDELTRCLPLLSDFVKEKKGLDSFDNKQCLSDVLNYMAERISS